MSTYLAALDESYDAANMAGPFLVGGVVAPERDWTEYIIPAWEERVLQRSPAIPYLHMTDIYDRRGFQREHRLSGLDAQNKVHEAASILRCTGSAWLFAAEIEDVGVFRTAFTGIKVQSEGARRRRFPFGPEHPCFVGNVLNMLGRVAAKDPDASSVNFVYEASSKKIDRELDGYFRTVPAVTAGTPGLSHLSTLLGQLTFRGKECVPLQVADLLVWHHRRCRAGKMSSEDRRHFDLLGKCFGLVDRRSTEEMLDLARRMLEEGSAEA